MRGNKSMIPLGLTSRRLRSAKPILDRALRPCAKSLHALNGFFRFPRKRDEMFPCLTSPQALSSVIPVTDFSLSRSAHSELFEIAILRV